MAADRDGFENLDRISAAAVAFSWMTTVSAPSGIGAPVRMRTAWPFSTLPPKAVTGRRNADHDETAGDRFDIV